MSESGRSMRARYAAAEARTRARHDAGAKASAGGSVILQRLAEWRTVYEDRRRQILGLVADHGSDVASPLRQDPASPQLHLKVLGLVSHLRHGVVESSLHAIVLLAGAGRSHPTAAVAAQLRLALRRLVEAGRQIEQFAGEVVDGVAVRDLLAREVATLLSSWAKLREEGEHAVGAPECGVRYDRIEVETRALLDVFEAMHQTLDRRRVAVADLVAEALQHEGARLREARVEVHWEPAASARARVFGNKDQIVSAVVEILRNAAHHGAGDESEPGYLEISLQSEPKDIEHAWLVFASRGGKAGGGSRASSGEGLALVRRVIEHDHGGRFGVVPAEGAHPFVVRLGFRVRCSP